jgi:flavin-dependent dehydrogenase
MWDKFYNLACANLDQNFKITDNFEITKYMMGICDKPKIDNTYFVGNCFGTMSPGLGFGQYTSILSGIYSALDICKKGTYEQLSKPLFENYNHSIALRRFLENLTDDKIDSGVKNLDSKIMGDLVDKICSDSSSIDLLKLVTPIIKLWNNVNGSER